MIKITLLNGTIKEYENSLTVKQAASSIATSLGKEALAGVVDNEIVDLNFEIKKDINLEVITSKSKESTNILNFTCGLASAAAILKLRKDAKIIGISFDNEKFFVDFDSSETIKESELDLITKTIQKLIEQNVPINFQYKTEQELYKIFNTNEFVREILQDNVDKYKGVYVCNEAIVVNSYVACDNIKNIKHFEIVQVAGAYFKNDASRKMTQRLTGFCRSSKQALEDYIQELQDRKERDHRKIGKELDIFMFSNLIGQGLPIWLPNGTIIKDQIKNYLKFKEYQYDFIPIETPIMGTVDLYKTSGHWDHYKEDMFPAMEFGDNEQLVLKPMSCPHHIQVYKNKIRSYKDLPIRYSEHALQHRYESAGSLTGLERVRAMELTDSHIFARHDQIGQEFDNCYKLINEVLTTFNIDIDYFSLSLRDPKNKEKYFDNDEMWNSAEMQLEQTLKDLNIPYKKMIGEAAFYGPKLDIQCKTALGHEITVSTIQLDFLLPTKFNVTYIDSNGQEQQPVMIHRGLIGTYERFISILLEQTKGKLPTWLSPVQVKIIPVNNEADKNYADEVKLLLKQNLIRSEVDLRDERLNYKIRDAQTKKIPYQFVLGTSESQNKTITYRKYGSQDQITVSLNEFIDLIKKEINVY